VNLTENHVRVLTALRGASLLRREPKVLTPDGHEHWWTLSELAGEGRLDDHGAYGPAELSSAARGLYKRHLVARRTIATVTRWAVTGDGLLALASYEAERGLSEVSAAQMDLDQACEDERQARAAVRAARERKAEAGIRLQDARDKRYQETHGGTR
jgi:hypothetical protein